MTRDIKHPLIRCAIYTRKSSEEGLEQAYNSLDAQRDACEAYIRAQAHEGWIALPQYYDDGGFSGGNVERPALKQLLSDIKNHEVDLVIVYKVDRLSRSLADFVRLVELLDQHNVSFVSVTQQFNTANSMGRLTLNVLLSFAQFEREVTSERIRDKIAASKKKGLWTGGPTPLGYDVVDKQLVVNEVEANLVKTLYTEYLKVGCVQHLKAWADDAGLCSKVRITQKGKRLGGCQFTRGALYTILKNPVYISKVKYKDTVHPGQHPPILEIPLWQQVQDQLTNNRIKRTRRVHARSPSLLAGLLYDDRGNPMSPAHTTKQGKRFRYYVSQALLRFEKSAEGAIRRLPASTVEEAVIADLIDWMDALADDTKACDDLAHHEHVAQTITPWKAALTYGAPAEKIAVLQKLVDHIAMSATAITITLASEQINETLRFSQLLDFPKRVIPAELKRTGIEKRLIINNQEPEKHPRSVASLQRRTLIALKLNYALITGQCQTITEFAKHEGLNRRYTTQLLELAFQSHEAIRSLIK